MSMLACRKLYVKIRVVSISNVAYPVKLSSTPGKMADVSKERLRKEITAILKNADLTKLSGKKLRHQLEKKLDVDLADQKKVVDELAMEILKEKKTSKKKKKEDGDDDDDEDEDGEENGGAGEDEDDEDDEEDGENEADVDDDEDDDDEDSDEKDKKKKGLKRRAPKKTKDSDSEEISEDDDEDEYSPKKKAKTSAKKGAGKKKKKGSDNDSDEDWAKKKSKKSGGGGGKRGGGGGGKGGYTKPCTLSPELAKLVGQETMPRHEVVKKIWAIIKERNLFDPNNKQFAICDNELAEVFAVKRFRTFGMMKYLKNHFVS